MSHRSCILSKGNPFFIYFKSLRYRNKYLQVIIVVLLVIIGYLWFFNTGVKFNLPKTVNYYDQLAESFSHGELSLGIKPDPQLLTLPDPYTYKSRGHISYPWDSSLYNGRFYLYWGPVPALAIMPVKAFYRGEIEDYYIVLMAVIGLFVFSLLLLFSSREQFFSELPTWTLGLGILLTGFATPLPWMLNRPAIYEASIASGQFFLVGGLYWIYKALSKGTLSIWKLMAAATFWSMAVGSRITLIFPVFFLVIMACFWIISHHREDSNIFFLFRQIAAIGLPLAIGISALGWYNWARFGSVIEFGYRYQLTGRNLNSLSNLTFLPTYIPTNAYNYFFNSYHFQSSFPFLSAKTGIDTMFINKGAPTIYRSERITGLLYDFPFVVFAFIPTITIINVFIKKRSIKINGDEEFNVGLLRWIQICLIGSAFISIMLLLLFFYSSMRYIADGLPTLALLSVLGFWQCYRVYEKPLWRYLIVFLGCGLSFVSITASILLTLSNFVGRFG